MSGSENRRRYQPRSEVRRAAAAEIPSLPPTLTNDHHHIHLTNQGDGRSVEEERDLLLFEYQLREGETVRAAGLQLEQMEFNHYLRMREMRLDPGFRERELLLREREMGLRERQWRLRAQKIIFFSFLALFGAYVLILFLRLRANNYVAEGEGGEGGEGGEEIEWVVVPVAVVVAVQTPAVIVSVVEWKIRRDATGYGDDAFGDLITVGWVYGGGRGAQ
ncbi:hypothetical protein BPOR_0715g00010 [Botrytis porri]|uniref:Uncharacterized protein n=1 Tax=Botrytis porri TaxID=87229 RepID=A0A4Z1KA83_9HELO|nr:hypothetical protein BPOR_0715g00010 [Botrytis porri]